MWINEFCARHSSDCVQMAEECAEEEQRRAWLELAQRWIQVADDARGPKHSADLLDGNGSGVSVGVTP
jgi:hypothetical protein